MENVKQFVDTIVKDAFLVNLLNEICIGIRIRNNLIKNALLKEKNHNPSCLKKLLKIHKKNTDLENTIPDRVHEGNFNKILEKLVRNSAYLNNCCAGIQR